MDVDRGASIKAPVVFIPIILDSIAREGGNWMVHGGRIMI